MNLSLTRGRDYGEELHMIGTRAATLLGFLTYPLNSYHSYRHHLSSGDVYKSERGPQGTWVKKSSRRQNIRQLLCIFCKNYTYCAYRVIMWLFFNTIITRRAKLSHILKPKQVISRGQTQALTSLPHGVYKSLFSWGSEEVWGHGCGDRRGLQCRCSGLYGEVFFLLLLRP